ncbi:MAG: hypothetical protein R2712_12380 [Vicinamibacterales bacterium]
MLRLVAPQFEHRLFLSATPHNGHTRSFTGLLEMLDPVRFAQTSELKPASKGRVQQVVLRRLKREINARKITAEVLHEEYAAAAGAVAVGTGSGARRRHSAPSAPGSVRLWPPATSGGAAPAALRWRSWASGC